ncbi:right-handed parallel beta-helix repeat-containing protein [Methanobrevibacter sp. TMH8]|uniref:right-handed parallel beta-helix repeat-containing protein n=1 Tax=Methanobrevibacter sp. TMH8 TaxID=2848611 RepID=UPI001CCF1F4B|nr:right-handed parallel beta-helix repeat-containing protein [Methanobrevibacter sp. TMH8]MBZ9570226.1 right-handed parallel beta-helix repeat-containing protein [Methanobrevibacter sp. TMH8]
MLYKKIIIIVFLLVFFLCVVSSVSAADHTVIGSTFEDIQDSIDGSGNNDRILLGNKTYTGSGSQIRVLNKTSIVIQGKSDSEHAVLDAHHLSRIIGVDENSTVTFLFIDFINGDSGIGGGSAIIAHGTIVVENCNFRNNWGESGGAIFIRPGVDDCTFINCSFINNQGRYEGDDEHVEGGAIDSHGNRTIIIDCIFKGNSALTTGGAVNLARGTGYQVINCVFEDNYANFGGAIRINMGEVLIENCTFKNNIANESNGGAIDSRYADLTIKNSNFTGNTAISNGGAINDLSNSNPAYLNIINCNFINNKATNGGGIYSQNPLNITDSNFNNNRADTGNSGGVYSAKAILIQNSNFISNTGRGLVLSGDGTIISGNNFTGNSEHAIRSNNLQNAIINNNRVINNGGTGLYITGNRNKIYSNVFTGNNIGVNVNGNYTNFTNNVVSNSDSNGLVLTGVEAIISGNNFTGNVEHAIRSTNLQNGIINNNRVINNGGTGLYITGNMNKIYDNVFNSNNVGVNVNGNYSNFTSNVVSNSDSNGVVLTGYGVTFVNNNISNNKGHGLVLNGNNPNIRNNRFIANGNHGIYSQLMNNAAVTNNVFLNNGFHGFYSTILNNGVITNNIFSNNKGAGFYTKGNNNKFFSNNFTLNNVGINIIGNNTNFKDNNVAYNLLEGAIFLGNYVYVTYNNFTGNKRNAVEIKGKNSIFDYNNVKGNSINSAGNCVVLITGNNAKVRYNNIKDNNFHGIHLYGDNSLVSYNNLSNNVGIELIVQGNKAKITYNNVFNGRGNGIYLVGNNGNLLYNKVHHNQIGISIKGNYNKVYKNTANYNKKQGLYFQGNKSNITYNNFNYNLRNGIRGEGNKNIVKNNTILNNSKNGKYCAVYFKGNYNNYTYNKIYNNWYHGLHAVGNYNRVSYTVLKNNKHTQGITVGNKNLLYNLTVYNGSKSGFGLYGNYNKLLKSKIYKNRNYGLAVKGNYNQLNRTIVYDNKIGIGVKGSKNRFLQNTIKSNKIGIYHKIGNKDYYNYNYIVNEKYNLYRVKGAINAEYNWWGENKKAKIKNTKINNYVVAYLIAPNILKLKKVHKIGVKFRDNKNKKLKLSIPSLKVKFRFDWAIVSPTYYNVTKNIAKAKIKVKQYGYYTLIARVDNQNLYKYYIGDSKGKLYDLKTYIAMEFKKQGIKANSVLVNKVYKSAVKKANNEKNKGEYKAYKSLRAYWLDIVKKMPDGPSKWLMGMVLVNFPKYDFNQYLKAGGLGKIMSNFRNLGPFGIFFDYYTTGKIQDGLNKNNGDFLKMLGESYLKFYGYSNIKNNDIKSLLSIIFGIDKNGNMSIFDTLLNVGLLALTIFTGGTSLSSRAGTSGGKLLTRIFGKYAKDVSRFFLNLGGNKLLSKSWEVLVDVSKVLNGNPLPILKRLIPDKVLTETVKQLYTGFKLSTGSWTTFLSQVLKYPAIKSYLGNFGKALTFGLGLNSIYNAYGNVKKISSMIPSYSTIVNVTNNVKSVVTTSIKTTVKKEVTRITIKAVNYYKGAKTVVGNFIKGTTDLGNKAVKVIKSTGNAAYGFVKWGLGKIGIKI